MHYKTVKFHPDINVILAQSESQQTRGFKLSTLLAIVSVCNAATQLLEKGRKKAMHPTVKFFIENSSSTVFKNRKVATAIVNTMRESTRYTPNMVEWWLYTMDNNFVPGSQSRKWLTSLLARDGWITYSKDMIFDSRKKPSRGTHPNTVRSTHWDEYIFVRGYKAVEMLREHAKAGEYAID